MRRVLVLLLGLVPSSAWAAGAGETTVAAGPALAVVHQGQTRVGAALDARLLYGLDDVWSVAGGLTFSWLPASDGAPAAALTVPALGVTAAADVLDWIPFVHAAVALADLRSSAGSQQRLGGQLGAGVDYLVSRHLAVTLFGRVDHFALALAGSDGPTPTQLVLGLALGHVF